MSRQLQLPAGPRERLDELLLSPLLAVGCGGRSTCLPQLTPQGVALSFFLSFQTLHACRHMMGCAAAAPLIRCRCSTSHPLVRLRMLLVRQLLLAKVMHPEVWTTKTLPSIERPPLPAGTADKPLAAAVTAAAVAAVAAAARAAAATSPFAAPAATAAAAAASTFAAVELFASA